MLDRYHLLAVTIAIAVAASPPPAAHADPTPASEDATRNGKAAKAAFEQAKAATTRTDATVKELITAIKAARTCQEIGFESDDHTLTTSEGVVTIKRLHELCQAQIEAIYKLPVKGCGFRSITFKAINLGGARWGEPEVFVTTNYSPGECDDVPKDDKVPAEFRKLAAKARPSCKGDKQMVIARAWGEPYLGESDGKRKRNLIGACWRTGTFTFSEFGEQN